MNLQTVVAEISARCALTAQPLMIAIDGRSGTGKSTFAAALAKSITAAIVPCDDFFAATVPDAVWDRMTAAERASDCIDWRRLRTEAIKPLRAGVPAEWVAFDFAAGPEPDGSFRPASVSTICGPAPVALLDGAYSARPEFADVLDLTVLVQASARVREARLLAREGGAFLQRWHARWDTAEDYYFGTVRPPESFDVVVSTDE